MKNPFSGKVDRWTVVALAIAALAVGGLAVSAIESSTAEPATAMEPASVEAIAGTDVSRVTLTEEAAKRLGIQTAKVAEVTTAGKKVTVIPYSALLYEPNGDTWTYTSTEPLVFVRQHITVERIEGDRVLLSAGPTVGTEVVTVGATELHGVEFGVGEE